MSITPLKVSKSKEDTYSKHFHQKKSEGLSVSFKLNIVNILVIISGLLSIIGAYEIQLGGKMHELNYFHQKYITEVIKSSEEFKASSKPIKEVEEDILQIRQQPIECLELIGPVELFMMNLIGTISAIQVCENDLQVANETLQKIQAYKTNEIDKDSLLKVLSKGIDEFEYSGVQFEPLIGKTVKITFLTVITIVIAKAFVVPVFGLVLSRSVANDYKLLLKTKSNLEKEKNRNALIQSERMASLTTMVAGIAHEINTPVGVSISATSHSMDLLDKVQQAYEDEQLTEDDLHDFFEESKKINNIINGNLLRTSKLIESFKQVSVDQSTDDTQTIVLKPYIEKILLTLTPLTKNSSVEVTLVSNTEGIQADIHGGALSQIVTNLVANVLNHAFKKDEQGALSISLSQTAENEIHLSFEDNGSGIPEKEQVHIFEPFFTTKRGHGGTGLGLHIVHNLVVDKLKGRILCSSVINEGTRFDIYFPTDFHRK